MLSGQGKFPDWLSQSHSAGGERGGPWVGQETEKGASSEPAQGEGQEAVGGETADPGPSRQEGPCRRTGLSPSRRARQDWGGAERTSML